MGLGLVVGLRCPVFRVLNLELSDTDARCSFKNAENPYILPVSEVCARRVSHRADKYKETSGSWKSNT